MANREVRAAAFCCQNSASCLASEDPSCPVPHYQGLGESTGLIWYEMCMVGQDDRDVWNAVTSLPPMRSGGLAISPGLLLARVNPNTSEPES